MESQTNHKCNHKCRGKMVERYVCQAFNQQNYYTTFLSFVICVVSVDFQIYELL